MLVVVQRRIVIDQHPAAVPLGIEDLGGYDYLADWPEREPSKFHMRPSERDANNGYSQHDRGDEVAERQPPTGQDQPQDIAKNAKWSGAHIWMSIILGA